MTCVVPGCGRPTRDTYTVDSACLRDLARRLREVPELAVALAEARGGLVRWRAPGVGNGGDWMPRWSDRATIAERRLAVALWRPIVHLEAHPAAGPYCTHCPHPSCARIRRTAPVRGTIRGTAAWLLGRLSELARRDEGGQWLSGIVDAVEGAWRAVDRPPERAYAGPCDTCGRDLYVRIGADEAACPTAGCGARYDLEERRRWLLLEAEDYLLTAVEITRALPTLGVAIGSSTVRQWAHRGRLLDHGQTGAGRPLYRVGDVLELAGQDSGSRPKVDDIHRRSA